MTDTSTNERRAMTAEVTISKPLSIIGECIRMGDGEDGVPRLIIRVDRETLRGLDGRLLYRFVNVSTIAKPL